MEACEQLRFEQLYQQHLLALKVQGKRPKTIDFYTLLIHGACAVLNGAKVARKKDRLFDRIQAWALALAERLGHNKAAVALANKTARRLWAAQHHGAAFDPDHRSERSQP